ncbi:MAG TPA: glycosyltransferase family 39 protein [Bryobacteraceae bacterium]|nr:glycosyltransferase family 39 protein [Bryobacteraceae bacterium]
MLASSEEAAAANSERPRWRVYAPSLAVFLLLFGYSAVLQHWNGAFGAEASGESDEAAHVVTGLMAHDYVARGFPGAPFDFAKEFYLHYPKVAIGHWPPFLYALLSGWMLPFPASIPSLVFLMALLAALFAWLLYGAVLREFGSQPAAALAGFFLLSVPLMERFGGLIMADLPLALWSVAAALAWGRYLDSERLRHAVLFALFSSCAILTKGDGLQLAMLPPLTILATRRWRLAGAKGPWLAAILVAALCLPWTAITMKLVTPTMQNGAGWAFSRIALPFYLIQLSHGAGGLIAALAVVGILVRFAPPFREAAPGGLWVSMAALLFADIVFHAAVPAGLEPRYLITGMFPLLLFAAAGVDRIGRKRKRYVIAAAAAVTALFFLFTFRITPKYSFGFAEAAADIVADPTLSHAAVLASSDRDGEGLLISEIALRERRNGHYVLRASKMLASSDWNRMNYRLRYSTAAAVAGLLNTLAVDVVVIDETPGVMHFQHHDLLREAVQGPEWRLAGVYPKIREGMAPHARVEMFRRRVPGGAFDPSRLSFPDMVKPLE